MWRGSVIFRQIVIKFRWMNNNNFILYIFELFRLWSRWCWFAAGCSFYCMQVWRRQRMPSRIMPPKVMNWANCTSVASSRLPARADGRAGRRVCRVRIDCWRKRDEASGPEFCLRISRIIDLWWTLYSIFSFQLTAAFLALDDINRQKDLLPGFKLTLHSNDSEVSDSDRRTAERSGCGLWWMAGSDDFDYAWNGLEMWDSVTKFSIEITQIFGWLWSK